MLTKLISPLLLLALCFENRTALAQNSEDVTINFDSEVAGKLPASWSAVSSTWVIAADGTNKAMKPSGKNKADQVNICIQNKLKYQNLQIETRIKSIEGGKEKGGGLVWRYHNPKNYYLAHVNPFENTLKIYKVVNGNRKEIKSVSVKLKVGEWHTLKVAMIGYTLACYVNDKKLLDVTDTSLPNAGWVGFWSKADAVSLFDDLKIKNLH
jgi:hypothetical protein